MKFRSETKLPKNIKIGLLVCFGVSVFTIIDLIYPLSELVTYTCSIVASVVAYKVI